MTATTVAIANIVQDAPSRTPAAKNKPSPVSTANVAAYER
jgi:hypothetical protein